MTNTETTAPATTLYEGGAISHRGEKFVIDFVRFYVQTNVQMARVWTVGNQNPILVRVAWDD